jgi:uncharacterized protein with PIN domain
MSAVSKPTLDCQQCGNVIRELTPDEAQQVSYNPYNFIVYCHTCKRDLA